MGAPPKTVRAAALLAVLITMATAAEPVFPGASWTRRAPAEHGLDAARLNEFARCAGGDG